MLSALQTSLSGLLSASNRAQLAADKIVRATARGSETVEAANVASGNQAYGAAVVFGPQGPGQQSPGRYEGSQGAALTDADADLVQGIVDLNLAAHAYKANAVALRTADETLGKFLDDLS